MLRAHRVAISAVFVGAVFVTSTISGPARSDELPSRATTFSGLPTTVEVAHRGGALEERENSLSGIEAATRLPDVDVVDLDTRTLADGTLVLLHDATVDRVSSGHGGVSSFTPASWSQLRLDVGQWMEPVPPPEAPPTVADVLDQYGGKVVLSLEVKDPRSVTRLSKELHRRGLVDSVIVNTNLPAVAQQLHALGLVTQLWRSATQMSSDDPSAFASYVDVLDVDQGATDSDIGRFVASGVPRVWAHTLVTRAERERVARLGVTGFVDDDPAYLTGATTSIPAGRTLVALVPPAPVQVSDRAQVKVTTTSESGLPLPAQLLATGPGVHTSEVRTVPPGVATVTVGTTISTPGRSPLELRATAGAQGELAWPSGSSSTELLTTPEDLQVVLATSHRRRLVSLRVGLWDSAADGYTGPRKEAAGSRTVAGLGRARLRVRFYRSGRLVHETTRVGLDDGTPRDGAGTVRLSWKARRSGTYRVVVTETGSVYRAPAVRRSVRVP